MINAIGYIRVSTDLQDFERQRQEVNDYAKRNDFSIIRIFEDKHSGSEYEERVGFQQMLSYLEENPFIKVVIFDEVSRMGRDTVQQVITYKMLTKKGIRIFTVGKGEFGSNKEDSLLFTVLSAIADYEKQTIIDRTSSGRRKVVKDGFTQLSQKPYGYDLVLTVKKDRRVYERQYLKINKEEAAVVKKIFEMINQGSTVYDVMKYLKKRGIKSPKGRDIWGHSTLLRVLHNTTYYGDWKFGKKYRNGKTRYSLSSRKEEDLITVKVPAIISKDIFNNVQHKISLRKSVLNPKNQKNIYLLKGITTCNCGRLLSCFFEGRSGKRTYRCPQKNIHGVTAKACPVKYITADYIEKILLQELKKKIEDNNFFKKIRTEKLKLSQSPIKDHELQIQRLIDDIRNKERLVEDYYRKAIESHAILPIKASTLEKLADQLLQEIEQKKKELNDLNKGLAGLKEKQIDLEDLKQVKKALGKIKRQELDDFNQDNQAKKLQFVRRYIKGIHLKYLDEETDILRDKIRSIRGLGLYKSKNKHLKPLYYTAFNKNHELRAKTAIQVLRLEVEFNNNYTLPIEFAYAHENPDIVISYATDKKMNILSNYEE